MFIEESMYHTIKDFVLKHYMAGVYRGTVENDCDPLQLGRVQVRIPAIHGLNISEGIATENLPWAQVIYPGSTAWDTGKFDPPTIGESVAVMFEMGDQKFPIVMGTWHGIPATPNAADNATMQNVTKYGESDNARNPDGIPVRNKAGGTWYGKNRPELPQEAQMMRNFDPTRRVMFKTQKGATLHMDEGDETEYFEMVDRAGQGLRMEARIKDEFNENNAEQRGLRSVFRGDQPRYDEKVQDRESTLRLLDLANQGIEMNTRRREERVTIQSKHPIFDPPAEGEENPIQKELREFNVGKEKQFFEMNAGHGITTFEAIQAGGVKIRIRYDANKPLIEIEANGENSAIVINGKRVTVGSEEVIIEGNIQLDGNVTISGDLLVTGEVIEGKLIEEGSDAYV